MPEVCRYDKCCTYVKPEIDGVPFNPFILLILAHLNNIASIAEAKLAQAKYYEEKRRYNFES